MAERVGGTTFAGAGAMRCAGWSSLGFGAVLFVLACSGKYTETGDGQNPGGIIQCDQYLACGVDAPCETGECIAVPGCGSAVCASSSVICEQACGERGCEVATSYPAQVSRCPDGTPIQGVGTGEPQPPLVGTGGSPSYAGTASGGYTSGGYGTAGTIAIGGAYGVGGTDSGPGVLDCQAFARCNGGDKGCSAEGFSCITIPGCMLGICAPPEPLCTSYCAGDCKFLVSSPLQISCSSGVITGVETGDPGAGGSSAAGGAPGWAGEPAIGGAPYGYAGEASGGAP